MSGRSLRPCTKESPRAPAKGKAAATETPIKKETKPRKKKAEDMVEGEADVNSWTDATEWASLFHEGTLHAVKGSKSREEWEIKVTVCCQQLFLQCRHVPGNRIPELMSLFQPTTTGVVHAASERPFFEKTMRELQTELSYVFETVSRIFLATPVGIEYVENFKRVKGHKHKPKWITGDLIDSAITITDVELCAFWTPLSLACGSGWFLDENLKSKMVSFVSIMQKQTHWILARFIRAMIQTADYGQDLSVAARQDIFLYSSRTDLLPAFPAPNGGHPKSIQEWMAVSPVIRSGMDTDEMQAFMRRYNYKTSVIIAKENRKAKELEEEKVRLEEANAIAARKAKEEKEAAAIRDAERKAAVEKGALEKAGGERSAHGRNAMDIDSDGVSDANDPAMGGSRVAGLVSTATVVGDGSKNPGGEVRGRGNVVGHEAQVASDVAATVGVNVQNMSLGVGPGPVRHTTATATTTATSLLLEPESANQDTKVGDSREEPQEIKDDSGGEVSDMGDTSSAATETDADDGYSDSDDDAVQVISAVNRDFSTAMSIDVRTSFTEEDLLLGTPQDEALRARVDDVRAVLELGGVRQWMDENLESLLMSGPVGISSWTLNMLGQLRQEFKRATVMIKKMDEDVVRGIEHVLSERKSAMEAEEVWKLARSQWRVDQDKLSDMRKEDLKAKKPAAMEGGVGLFGNVDNGSGKKHSFYADEKRGKKKPKSDKAKAPTNPFEMSGRGSCSETLG